MRQYAGIASPRQEQGKGDTGGHGQWITRVLSSPIDMDRVYQNSVLCTTL
jgi:hypothetical protein